MVGFLILGCFGNRIFENEVFYRKKSYFIWQNTIEKGYQSVGSDKLVFEKMLMDIETTPEWEAEYVTRFELIGDAIKKQKAFTLEIEGLNMFGAQKSPRIFWAAVNELNELFQLQEIVHKTCLAAGFTLETRPYHSHITLARKWGGEEDFKMDDLIAHNPFGDYRVIFQMITCCKV